MATYKCINCGEIKENDAFCSCSVCGYRMFEMPYERKEIIASQIKAFISFLQVTEVKREALIFKGKEKDDNRFPSYNKIVKFVSEKTRTEDFLKNLLETIRQLQMHYTTQFSKTYSVSFENIYDTIKERDELLSEVLDEISSDIKIKLKTVEFGEASLLYEETQNKYLWSSANELLNKIEKLANKIVNFIKVNNLYGDAHKYHPQKSKKELNEKTDFKELLEDAIFDVDKKLNKKYVVDIMDDGAEEIKEMLTCLWRSIEFIMASPLFIKNYNYLTSAGGISEKELLEQYSQILQEKYKDYNQAIDTAINTKTEEELFDIYKQLIDIDEFGFLVPLGTNLINIGESEKELNKLIGLSDIKESVRKIKAYALSNKGNSALNLHMCFYGNPGTGKTEVARIIADILYENKILPSNKVVEVDRSGLVGQYVGETPQKTMEKIDEAMGGVLFIDEAYSLAPKDAGFDYGHEAVATLIKAMEDNRGKFCVILAGYKNQMLDMIATNPGFRSRIQFELEFPNYSREELKDITDLMLKKRKYTISDAAMQKVLDITDVKRREPNFANAREIRNILDGVIMCQNLRSMGAGDSEIGIIDVNKYITDTKINLPQSISEPKILTAEEELENLVGLGSVKRMVKKIKAFAKKNKDESDFNLHMCFYGNPGTGKTEVARIISSILYDTGVLAEAKLVETDSHGLIGKFVGETAPKTQAKISDAMNGVLFIDEAYGLTNSTGNLSNGYGDEAIEVLLKNMEDHRGKFCTILAGYKKEMQAMLASNPGFQSRIQFVLEFPDYTREELGQIAVKFLTKKKYTIDSSALELFLDVTEYYRNHDNFANARTVRNILDQVIMNQNLRTEDEDDNTEIIRSDVEDYILDENINLTDKNKPTQKIGF